MNLNNKAEFKNLVDDVNDSKTQMRPFRENRTALVSTLVGSEYSDDGEKRRVYLNLLAMATNIYVRQCAVRAPTARVVTPHYELRPQAMNLSIACKELARETDLGVTLRRAVAEALLSPMATVKIGLTKKGTRDVYGTGDEIDITDPFVTLVSFDDYVQDMSSRSAYDPAYKGDTYYMTIDELHELYPQTKKLELSKDELDVKSETGEDRAEHIAHTSISGDNHFKPKVAVQDIWLTKERVMVTYLLHHADKPLDIVEYDSTTKGPYHSLWFTDVPDNAMPLPPFSLLKNIHKLANSMYRRMAYQAEHQKNVVAFNKAEDAVNFDKCRDGHSMQFSGQPPTDVSAGGIDQRMFAFFLQNKDLFSWAAGNLDSLGGLSPMAETAKQDEMLSQSASAQLADMQDATSEFAESIFRELAWMEWTDEERNRVLSKSIGAGMDIAIPWTPETRQGDFLDMNFTIIPQSMREDSPAAKLEKMNVMLSQVFMPMAPIFEQQGLMIDAKQLVAYFADYSNMPELEKVIVAMDGEQFTQGPTGSPTPSIGTPSHTTRTYERINRSGATRVGKEQSLMMKMMGGDVQPSEEEAIGRSVG